MLTALLLLASTAAAAPVEPAFARKVAEAAQAQTKERVVYDGRYVRLAYPGGDVPFRDGRA